MTANPGLEFTEHALLQMRRRRITREFVLHVVAEPDWRNARADGRTEYVAVVEDQSGQMPVTRRIEVVIEEGVDPHEVVTAYELTTEW